MLTDEQALRLIESVRHNTRSTEVAAVCDWVLALVQRREVEAAAPAAAAPKADRRAYMRDYMRRKRAEKK